MPHTPIQVVLWDIDGTLLDFAPAERIALETCFDRFGLGPLSPERLARYSAVNRTYWRRLERGELTKPQVLLGRFEEFFRLERLPCPDLDAFNAAYQLLLGETVVFQPGALETVQILKAHGIRQFAATNGTRVAQRRKLERSGLLQLLDGVFISEEIGAEKPAPAFFRAALAQAGDPPRRNVFMVGDSLTSDIRGAVDAGLVSCWYNPSGEPLPREPVPDYIISQLSQVLALTGI